MLILKVETSCWRGVVVMLMEVLDEVKLDMAGLCWSCEGVVRVI